MGDRMHRHLETAVNSRRSLLGFLAAGLAGATGLLNRGALAQTGAPSPPSRSAMITAIAIARAKPGQENELGRRMKALVAPTLAEPGCINYDLHRSNTDPAVWIFYENWQSQADLDAHMQSAHYRSFFSRADEVLAHVDAYFSSMMLPPGGSYRRC